VVFIPKMYMHLSGQEIDAAAMFGKAIQASNAVADSSTGAPQTGPNDVVAMPRNSGGGPGPGQVPPLAGVSAAAAAAPDNPIRVQPRGSYSGSKKRDPTPPRPGGGTAAGEAVDGPIAAAGGGGAGGAGGGKISSLRAGSRASGQVEISPLRGSVIPKR
jgi:hypothetical protein